ncbi:MAG TPA: SprT family zinc-dependent metalloprotease [Verrucomicrobiae bacterium]|nr:SprT family zinc-dependent metalloprotease [Verrucomicrobiae bacterium]
MSPGPSQLRLTEAWPVHERVSRRARRVRVDVRPDGAVVLTIPQHASRTAALRFLEHSRSWIERTRERLARARQSAPPLRGVGETLAQVRERAAAEARHLLDQESARLGLPYSRFTLRDPRSRWGSCAADGRIMLSWRLALAPAEVFRYVVVHELCHLRWRGHGPRFWALVARQMPDYEAACGWLREHGAALLMASGDLPATRAPQVHQQQ